MIKITNREAQILKMFANVYKRSKVCPTNKQLGNAVGCSAETIRVNLNSLAKKRIIKINKKAKSRKFYA